MLLHTVIVRLGGQFTMHLPLVSDTIVSSVSYFLSVFNLCRRCGDVDRRCRPFSEERRSSLFRRHQNVIFQRSRWELTMWSIIAGRSLSRVKAIVPQGVKRGDQPTCTRIFSPTWRRHSPVIQRNSLGRPQSILVEPKLIVRQSTDRRVQSVSLPGFPI
jgi:hypothetical protein